MTPKKKKKVDYIALSSPFMRIAGMKVDGARALLDLGFKEVYELKGRAPEALFDELKSKRLKTDPMLVKFMEIAVSFAEQE
jgi:hypothetical protein